MAHFWRTTYVCMSIFKLAIYTVSMREKSFLAKEWTGWTFWSLCYIKRFPLGDKPDQKLCTCKGKPQDVPIFFDNTSGHKSKYNFLISSIIVPSLVLSWP